MLDWLVLALLVEPLHGHYQVRHEPHLFPQQPWPSHHPPNPANCEDVLGRARSVSEATVGQEAGAPFGHVGGGVLWAGLGSRDWQRRRWCTSAGGWSFCLEKWWGFWWSGGGWRELRCVWSFLNGGLRFCKIGSLSLLNALIFEALTAMALLFALFHDLHLFRCCSDLMEEAKVSAQSYHC